MPDLYVVPPASWPDGRSDRVDQADRETVAAGLEAIAKVIRTGSTFHDCSGIVYVLISPDGIDVGTFGDIGPAGMAWAREAVVDAVAATAGATDPLEIQQSIDKSWEIRRANDQERAGR